MNVMIFRPAFRTFAALVTCVTLGILQGSLNSAVTKVPRQEDLERRVGEFYSTINRLKSRERLAAQVKFLPPLLRECAERHLADEDAHIDPDVEVLSWKISEIQYDSTRVGKKAAYCSGKTYIVDAAASVVVQQRDRESGGQPESGEIEQHWVFVGSTWYLVGVD
jgi:hypothetical protein